MPDVSQLAAFALASLLLAITPGPDLIYVIMRGAAQGKRVGVTAAAGLCTGIIGHTAFCVIGLSALVAASATAFTVLKFAGAAYLVYLAIRMWRSNDALDLTDTLHTAPLGAIFRQSVIMNLVNPKVALFFLAFLPQFVDPAAGPVAVQFALLGVIFMLAGFFVMGSAGLGAGHLRRYLATNARTSRYLRFGAGAVFFGLGVRLAFAESR